MKQVCLVHGAFDMGTPDYRDCPMCKAYRLVGDGTEKASSKQEGGAHYTKLPIQPFEYSMKNGLDPMQHTAIKYITRFRDKNGLEDLRKAIHTIEMLIEWEMSRTS